ncbi:dipeptide ABC transporter ATP-binding protein [Arenibaculum pallidiluteum]|uniref:dipeptide ABC transporter ATP-binding protein n=1 Tax=Arenibaculum pallidiluteum TaxID=2812559 RepID=UPI001A96CE34|nr:ABC transporter ATP-binding protein [Arenibaculum pallidiluteum]
MSTPVLELDGVTVSYPRPDGFRGAAVRDVSLAVAPGQALGLAGESGCGKSTLAFAALRHLPRGGRLEAGSVRFLGSDLYALSRSELRGLWGRRMAVVYQNPGGALNPTIPVGEQIAEVYRYHLGLDRAAARDAAIGMLERVRMANPGRVADLYPHELSGGMQQRAVIAMALATDPELLVLDEPTTALDTTVQAEILDLFAALRREFRAALLLVGHNLGVLRRVCDTLAVMYAGEIVEQGPTAALLARPRHPYASALLGCVPDAGRGAREGRLASIPGLPPSPGTAGPGCSFVRRCPIARPAFCGAEHPPLYPQGPGRAARCHFAEETPEPGTGAAVAAGGSAPVPAPGAEAPVLHVSGLSFARGPVEILRDIDLRVAAGETLGLVGESGSGKSTLALLVAGLLAPSGGEIRLDGAALAGRSRRRSTLQRRAVQMVFQSPDTALNPRRRVGRILERPARVLAGLGRAAAREKARALLEDVALPEGLIDSFPVQLSGGQRQRIAIARAFVGEPRLVLLDEPTSALDVSVQAAVLNLLRDLQRRSGAAYLFISHDLAVVRYMADRIAVLYQGELVEEGPAERVFAPPHHPYTEALIAAVPRLDGTSAAAGADEGGDAADGEGQARAAGCVFRRRCAAAGPRCAEPPPWRDLGGGHRIRCWVRPGAGDAAGRAS